LAGHAGLAKSFKLAGELIKLLVQLLCWFCWVNLGDIFTILLFVKSKQTRAIYFIVIHGVYQTVHLLYGTLSTLTFCICLPPYVCKQTTFPTHTDTPTRLNTDIDVTFGCSWVWVKVPAQNCNQLRAQ